MAKKTKNGVLIGACAAISLTGIVAISKINFSAQMGMAREYISNAEYSKAAEILDEQKDKNNFSEDVYLLYADYYIAQEEYQNAVDILTEGTHKAYDTDKIKAKISEINSLYESELKQESELDPAESEEILETTTAENDATSEDEPTPVESEKEPEITTTKNITISEAETSEIEFYTLPAPESTRTESSSAAITPKQTPSSTLSTSQRKLGGVYIAASGNGTKYHKSPNCSKMNGNVIEMSREEAEAAGYTPCKKNSCYG